MTKIDARSNSGLAAVSFDPVTRSAWVAGGSVENREPTLSLSLSLCAGWNRYLPTLPVQPTLPPEPYPHSPPSTLFFEKRKGCDEMKTPPGSLRANNRDPGWTSSPGFTRNRKKNPG